MTDQHQIRTSESAPANTINVVMGEGPNASSAHLNKSVLDEQPTSVAAATSRTVHTTQVKESKPPKINGKHASVASVIES